MCECPHNDPCEMIVINNDGDDDWQAELTRLVERVVARRIAKLEKMHP